MQSYFQVAIADPAYHGKDTLTYKTNREVEVGSIVTVPLRKNNVFGIVVEIVKKPSFAVKDIVELARVKPLPTQLIDLATWIQHYYASSTGAATQLLVPSRMIEPEETATFDSPSLDALPSLTEEQKSALEAILGPGMHILHGDTGTGKTRVYIELAKRALSQNRSSIILSPEIGLTPQLEENFKLVFGNRVFVLHSQLKESNRQKIWSSILNTSEPVVLIGARSALFAPIKNLGLIVVDEAHETAYKQDQAPYYHATRVASKLAELHEATTVLGSATPLITDYYLATQKKRPIIRMSRTAIGSNQNSRKSSVIDLRDPNNQSKKQFLSNTLVEAMSTTLSKHEQILLFLNRRGTARVVICNNCGWQALCPKCDLTLTYHGDLHVMLCHSCNYRGALPNSCPKCHNVEIVLKSIGTKAVTDAASSLFPEAKIMRFDTDNKKMERIEQHYDIVRSGEVDIIIGTQTLAKGLDLPKLGLVGVIIADTGLYFPDFSSQERTYELLYQVLGRVGRGHRSGSAIIQTYLPDSPVISQAVENNWNAFYNNEIAERKQFLFPPFCHLLKLTCKRATSLAAQNAAEKFARQLMQQKFRVIIEGPTPCFHEKLNNKYCWQLVIKAKDRNQLLGIVDALPSGWSYDIDPMNLL